MRDIITEIIDEIDGMAEDINPTPEPEPEPEPEPQVTLTRKKGGTKK